MGLKINIAIGAVIGAALGVGAAADGLNDTLTHAIPAHPIAMAITAVVFACIGAFAVGFVQTMPPELMGHE